LKGDYDENALNGAQISSMVEIVTSVSSGEPPRTSGVEMLMLSYQMSQDRAEKIMADAGTGDFKRMTGSESDEHLSQNAA
jgi:hypothetical protein